MAPGFSLLSLRCWGAEVGAWSSVFSPAVHKTEEEVQEILARKEAKLKLKTERRQQQEAAVERKRQQREAHR